MKRFENRCQTEKNASGERACLRAEGVFAELNEAAEWR